MAKTTVEIELELLKEKLGKDLDAAEKDIQNKLGGVGKSTAASQDSQNKKSETALRLKQRMAREDEQSQRRSIRSGRDEERRQKEEERRLERVLKLQQRMRRIEEGPDRVGLGFGSALMAGGATLAQGAMMHQGVRLLGSIGVRMSEGRNLARDKKAYEAAVAGGDAEKIEEATQNYSASKTATALATKNAMVAGATALAALAVKGAMDAYKNEQVQRTLFQVTGQTGSDLFSEQRMRQFSKFGLDGRESIMLASQLGKAGGVSTTQAGGSLEYLARIKQSFGDQAADQTLGMISTAQARGAVTGSGAMRDKQVADLIGRATGVYVATGLERGRFGEAMQAMQELGNSLLPGQKTDFEQVAKLLAMVGREGDQFKGMGGLSTAQAIQNFGQGRGGMMSQIIASQMAFKGKPNDMLDFEIGKEGQKDPEQMARTVLKITGRNRKNIRNFAFGAMREGDFQSGEQAQAFADIVEKVGRGEKITDADKKSLLNPEQGLKKLQESELPQSLHNFDEAVKLFSDASIRWGELGKKFAPAVLTGASTALNMSDTGGSKTGKAIDSVASMVGSIKPNIENKGVVQGIVSTIFDPIKDKVKDSIASVIGMPKVGSPIVNGSAPAVSTVKAMPPVDHVPQHFQLPDVNITLEHPSGELQQMRVKNARVKTPSHPGALGGQ